MSIGNDLEDRLGALEMENESAKNVIWKIG